MSERKAFSEAGKSLVTEVLKQAVAFSICFRHEFTLCFYSAVDSCKWEVKWRTLGLSRLMAEPT